MDGINLLPHKEIIALNSVMELSPENAHLVSGLKPIIIIIKCIIKLLNY
jgi:hypothetical protein